MNGESKPRFSLTEQLLQRFNLLKDPFSGQSGNFFSGAQRQYVLETLGHLVNFGDMVLLLTGDRGSGKTVLLKELSKKYAEKLRLIEVSPAQINSAREMVNVLFNALALTPVESEPVYRSIQRIMEKSAEDYKQGTRTLFMIDDSEALSADVFQLLIKTFKDVGVESGIVLLLAGKSEIIKMVIRQGVQPEQCDWIHQLQLKPLSVDEMEAYIQFCFDRAGGDVINLTSDQKDTLTELGKGNPGRINRVAPAVLLGADLALNRKVPKTLSPLHFKLALGVFGILVISFVIVAYEYGLFDRKPISTSITAKSQDAIRDAINAKIEATLQAQAAQKQHDKLPAILTSTNLSKPAASKDDVNQIEPTTKTPSSAEKNIKETRKESLPVQEVPATVSKKASVVNTSVDRLSSVSPREKQIVSEIDKPSDNTSKVPLSRYQKSIDSLKINYPSGYVIQLSSNKNKQTAIEYIKYSGHSNQLFYLITKNKYGIRYIVLFGAYPSYSDAHKALSSMPTKLLKQKPYVRSLAGIKPK
jgi:type II secretory pathway predicted ATPase ExeA/septal ring-binding cell division protein DamX